MLRQNFFIIVLIMAGIVFGPGFAVAASNFPDVFVSSDALFQGDTLLVVVKNEINAVTGNLGSAPLRFFRNENGQDWVALVGIPLNKEPGSYKLLVNVPDKPVFEKNILVSEKNFPTSPLVITKSLSQKGYTVKSIINNAVNNDNKILAKVFDKITPQTYVSQPFIFPLSDVKETGAFGNIREAKGYKIQHLGADLKAPINTPIYAANSGKVVLTKTLRDYGKAVVIDHGLGVYSLYAHLGYIDVKNGQSVKQGEIIGLSGNTGYSIAPHLHFSIKVRTASLDPLKFIQTSQAQW